jgi:TetR/AcrR family transcriptional regulator, regulator of autoinduction and epiphytic fitness
VARVSSPLGLDGRTARRHRNTDAVLDAVHQLFVEGHRVPTVEDVATRSGVSLRSIYRYFPDRDELLRAALARRMHVAEPLFHLDDLGVGSLPERIERFATHRMELYDAMAPTARAALREAVTAPVIAEVVRQRRTQLTEQTRQHFARELEALPEQRAANVLAAMDVLSQFEAVEELRVGRGLPPDRAREVLVGALRALLGAERPG